MTKGDEHLDIVGAYMLPGGTRSTFQGPLPREGEVVDMKNQDGSTTRYVVKSITWQVDSAFRESGVPQNFAVIHLRLPVELADG